MRRLTAVIRDLNSKLRAAKEGFNGRIRYGGAWASSASMLPLRRAPASILLASLRRPWRVAKLLVLLLRTPREYVVLSGSSAGQALDAYFNQRSRGAIPSTRFCQGVLLLPRDHADYLRGRRRQALRTNLRRAAAAGIWCEVVSDPGRALDDIYQVLRHQWASLPDAQLQGLLDDLRAAVVLSEVTIAVARDEHGRPLAMVAAVIDETVCLIKHAVAVTHEARWALHNHLVRVLIARQVRYLLADGGGPFGALGFAANVRHYQHLLGYELRHVILAGRRRTTRRRRLLASLAVVTATVAVTVPRAAASPAHWTTPHPALQAVGRAAELR